MAVILILGIIALIAIPTVNNIINSAKLGALDSTVQNIAKSIEENCQMQKLRDEEVTSIYNITNGISDVNFDIKGKLPEEATIIVDDDCNVMVSALDDNASSFKDFGDKETITRQKKVETPFESCFTYEEVEGGIEITSYNCGDTPNFELFSAEMLAFYMSQREENEIEDFRNWDKEAAYRNFIKYNHDGKYIDIVLPDTLDGKKVVGIGKYAFSHFHNAGITSIKLNKSLTYIDKYAFVGNELNTIEFNEGLKNIRNYAFSFNNLTKITLPSSIEEINYMAFGHNRIINYSIPNTILILENGFMNDNCLPVSMAFITRLENGIDDTSKLISYGGLNKYPIIPNTITSIENNAFFGIGLFNVTIPSTVTHIQAGSFNNNLFSDENAFIYKRNNDGSIDTTTLVSYAGKKQDIVIPNNVINIEDYALSENVLKSIVFPSNLRIIGDYAFNINDLTAITIPNNVEEIGIMAFRKNELLTTINIDKENGTLTNSPWGATSATINYLR